ncbi:hypothetical protein JR316_0011309 [Psilocybe cubensis]|uniref:Uncharacterized protein n=1 Tax=Psilocybe cubensis TaxID=181762 RepID=A0ACB8GJ37_PSICU|nr:hypothetical protein JR316_0011309 [Psilocybe cubensis]KAH9475750.1 hypothetical protein JR316_0011309 [Psilocybe cubensis]
MKLWLPCLSYHAALSAVAAKAFLSTEIFMSVIEIFDSTSELEVQENVMNALEHIINHESSACSMFTLEYMDTLSANLASNDSAIQLSTIEIVLEIATTKDGRSTIMLSSALGRIMKLGTSPDNYVSQAVLSGVGYLCGYGA